MNPVDRSRKLANIKISELKPDPRNTKLHPAGQIDQIAKSIKRYGFTDPIEIDEYNNVINGHGRLQAIQKLIERGDWTEETVPCIILDMNSTHRRRAYGIAHNQLTLSTTLDFDTLRVEMDALSITTDDLLAGGGFDFDGLRLLAPKTDTDAFKKIKEDTSSWAHLVDAVHKTDLVFTEEEDQMAWMQFIQYLGKRYPGEETIADRVLKFIEETNAA